MPITLNGTTGVTTPGLDSTAMPTVGGDAVVESGSNSDGEWVKWSEGTAICEDYRTAGLTGGTSTPIGNNRHDFSWTLPLTLVSAPQVGGIGISIDSGNTGWGVIASGSTSTVVNFRYWTDTLNPASTGLGQWVIGRWK